MRIIYLSLLMFISFRIAAAPPTLPASTLGFYAIDGGYFNIGWTAGNGARRLLICKAGSAVTFVPADGSTFAASDVFGSGAEVAPGEFAIYDNAFTSFYLNGLSPATKYYFALFEYNGTGTNTEYLTSSFLSGYATTSSAPTVQVSNASFSTVTTNSVTVSWTNGDGLRRMIVAREGSAVTADPVSGTSYLDNSNFGAGGEIGNGNFVVYRSSDNSTTIRSLKPGTEYHLAFYELNGSSQPQYKKPAYTTSVTTRSAPTNASSNVVITKTDGKALTLNWDNGNGQRRMIIARKGDEVTAIPANNTVYNANNNFETGAQITPGEYVVFDDDFNQATITGLDTASTYYFRIFEYDGGAGNAAYLTSSFGSVNGPTAATPTVQAKNISTANIGATSLTLAMAAGNGRARLIVARKNTAVNAAPADFTVYTGNTFFGNGENLGGGNFVVGNITGLNSAVNQLEPNTTYHFAVFEYNGYNQPIYREPAAVFSVTTSAPLPVKLTYWAAIAENEKVKLQWTTSSELNSNYFLVQRSSDGINFSDIAKVTAAGNSQLPISYANEDIHPLSGRSFYRLKMVDKDGSAELSPVAAIMLGDNAKVVILQNPVRDAVEIVIPGTIHSDNDQWVIINSSGQLIKKGTVNNTRIRVDVGSMPTGNYWLKVCTNKQVQNLPFTKL